MMKRLALPVLCLPLLAGCVNDSISMIIDGPSHAISLVRGQKLFWEKKMDLEIIVTRLPDCQRRHHLQPAVVSSGFKVEVYDLGQNTFLLDEGGKLYVTETRTCLGFQQLSAPPAEGKGELLGAFREEQGQLVFRAAR